MQQHIVYQAYGSKAILQELVYSIRSIERLPSAASFSYHVYTDQASWLEPFLKGINIQYHTIGNDTIRDWRGSIDFVHRVKIRMLQDFSTHVPNDKILYLDTDVICQQPIDTCWELIGTQQFLMHIDEGPLNSKTVPLFRKVYPVIEQAAGKGQLQTADFHIWNAGLIGFENSSPHLLQQVLELTDTLYQQYPKHIMEQLAFSYCLQKAGHVAGASGYFFHYWLLKEFREILARVFELPLPQCLATIALLQEKKVAEKLCEEKLRNVQQRSAGFLSKLLHKKWQCPTAEKAMQDAGIPFLPANR